MIKLNVVKKPQKDIGAPARTLLSGKPYIPAAKTDVLRTFKQFGFKPPSEATK